MTAFQRLNAGFVTECRCNRARAGRGGFFGIAMWLIASSTLTGMLLMRWLRQWRAAATEGVSS